MICHNILLRLISNYKKVKLSLGSNLNKHISCDSKYIENSKIIFTLSSKNSM